MPVITLTQDLVDRGLAVPEGKAKIEWCDAVVRSLRLEQRAASDVKSYYVRYRDNGGVTRHVKLGRASALSLQNARAQAKKLLAEIALGRDPRGEEKARRAALTFTEFFEQHYLPHVTPRKRSWKRDEELFRLRIKAKFGHLRLADIRRQQLQAFHTELKEEGLAPATCDHHLKLIKHALNLAIEWEMLEKNPASRVPLFNADNRVENIPDEEQLARLLHVLRTDANRTVCLVGMLLISTGVRLGTALRAKWSQFDRQNRLWRIPAGNSKSGKVMSVPLNDSAIEVLDQLDTEGEFEHLFVNRRRSTKTEQRLKTVMKVWRRLREKAGLPHLRLHDLRHIHASLLINSGRSLYEVQRVLLHSSPVVTQRYAHLSSKSLQDATNTASLAIQRAIQRHQSDPAGGTPGAAAAAATEAANSPSAGGDAEAPHRQPEDGQRAA